MKNLIAITSLLAAGTALANADYVWNNTQNYNYTWDFGASNTQNGQPGVLGGTVTNTFVTETIDNGETALKKGSSAGGYWEVGTNSFFYDALSEVSKVDSTASLTFTLDYYWTGESRWGECIFHVGQVDTGISLGLAPNGYISLITTSVNDAHFTESKTDVQLTANIWQTISVTISGGQWFASLGEQTSNAMTLGALTWASDEAERNKYSIGVKAPGYTGGTTGLNDSGCKLANISVSYSGIPEPSAFGLLAGAGALALVAARRRRTKKA